MFNIPKNNNFQHSHTFVHDGKNSRNMFHTPLKMCFKVQRLRFAVCPEIDALSEKFWEQVKVWRWQIRGTQGMITLYHVMFCQKAFHIESTVGSNIVMQKEQTVTSTLMNHLCLPSPNWKWCNHCTFISFSHFIDYAITSTWWHILMYFHSLTTHTVQEFNRHTLYIDLTKIPNQIN